MDQIKKQKEAWEQQTVQQILQRFPERRDHFVTSSGIEMARLYTPLDFPEERYLEELGFPGEYPYTRGVHPTMYRGRFWTMRQYAGFASAEESNRRYKYLLEHGQTGLSVAFDLPTQMGYDSDHPQVTGEVGKVGVAIDSLQDMEILFQDIPLDRVSTSMTINATAAILLAMYIAVARKQQVDLTRLRGTVQNDILKEYIARGTYIYPPAPSMRIITDIFAYARQHLPNWNTISISGYHIREAGSSAVQEVAFTLANAITYVEAALQAGLDIDSFATRLSFFFGVHNHFLEEIAKFRAARRLWARIMRDRFQAKEPRSWLLRFHSQTAGCTLTAQQPENNIIRVAIQALAAVLGGTQSLHTNAFDEALGLPSEETARIALRTQQVLAHENGVTDTVDPLGGSYAIEALTGEIEHRVQDYLEKIEAMGGMLRAIETGYVQEEIQKSAYQYQREVEAQQTIVVGVNAFRTEEEATIPVVQIDPAVEKRQKEKLYHLRKERNKEKVRAILAHLEDAARGTDNLFPIILEAVEAYATLGEISDTLRRVFGEYQEKIVL